MCPPLWPIYIGVKRTTFAKAYGIKKKVILRTCWGNITRTWGRNWEHDGNPLGTTENEKKPPHPNPKGKKVGHHHELHVISLPKTVHHHFWPRLMAGAEFWKHSYSQPLPS